MYIIKKHYEATEKNTNFASDVRDYYLGKGQHLIGRNTFPTAWEINTFGYRTKAAAMKGLKSATELANSETRDGWWVVTAELVEV